MPRPAGNQCPGGRDPNRAVPRRSIVDPHSSARCQSPDMPVEHTPRASRSHRLRTTRNAASVASESPDVGPTPIRPSTTRPARTALSTSASTSRGGVHLYEHARSLRALPRDDIDDALAVHRLPQIDHRGEHANLVGLDAPDEVHRQTRRALGEFGRQLLGVVLSDRIASGQPGSFHGITAERLGHGDDGHPFATERRQFRTDGRDLPAHHTDVHTVAGAAGIGHFMNDGTSKSSSPDSGSSSAKMSRTDASERPSLRESVDRVEEAPRDGLR